MSATTKKPAARKATARKTAASPSKSARSAKPRAQKPAASAKTRDAASRLIDKRIEELGDWRGDMLAHARGLIRQVDPDVLEEWKWRGVPVWSHDGIVCTGESYKAVVKFTFAKGASLPDPKRLFNSSLEGNTRRAIDLHEGDTLDAAAFKTLVRAAIALNSAGRKGKR